MDDNYMYGDLNQMEMIDTQPSEWYNPVTMDTIYQRQELVKLLLDKFEGHETESIIKHARVLENYIFNG